MFARVVNFHWSFMPDGSYDITLDLISIGDVVDSFKINTLNPTVSTSSPATDSTTTPTIEEEIDLYANKSTIGQYLYKMKRFYAMVKHKNINSSKRVLVLKTNYYEINLIKQFDYIYNSSNVSFFYFKSTKC